ncbi:MAG: alpha-hydroxy-acid oxidizing protein [Clostridiales Family XIII bacterium]|jgi:isopentenyl diphosphate isomerase/L-lactate dehydrogenase-like FMN-dependent dehydrogenase|nr:alpha-hydroxy-acid oxidizing protein [Clostridiales Family XIII bacterium]
MIGKLIEDGRAKLSEKHISFDNGAETSSAPRLAREYMDALAIEIRAIDAVRAQTQTRILGVDFETPIMTAALSGLNGVYPNSLSEIAKGALSAGAGTGVGIGDEEELAGVTATGAKTYKIVKPFRDHDLILEQIKQAEKHGAFATGMDTIFGFGAKNGDTLIRDDLMSPKSFEELKSFVRATSLPFIVKGVLSVSDAKKAAEAGAAAIVVSGHGGSALDYSVPPLRILPDIARAVGSDVAILIDGGFARGTDVFKALALGANGVLVGRAVIHALALGGAEPVGQLLNGMTEELRRVMSLTGSADIGHIDPAVIW